MTDSQTRPDADDRSKQAKPAPPDQQAKPSQASGAKEPAQRRPAGRKPLFGT